MLELVLEQASEKSSKQALVSIAHCVAELCVTSGPEKSASTANKLMQQLSGVNVKLQQLYLFSIGEIGRRMDLSVHRVRICFVYLIVIHGEYCAENFMSLVRELRMQYWRRLTPSLKR